VTLEAKGRYQYRIRDRKCWKICIHGSNV